MASRTPAPSSSSSRRARAIDDSIGQFVIDKEIGKGSFAQVYSGRHKVTGALVAIKSVELGRLNKKLKENLYGEIKILKKLRHPHIVALHDCVESTTHINLIMEYCELGDLSLFIKRRDKLITISATHELARKYPVAPNAGLNEVLTRHFLQQLASALKFLREGNFVHRDVKPQNLLLLPPPAWREANKSTKQILSASHDSLTPAVGVPSLPMLKLADFGFARVLPSTSLAETLCGSPLYMAPEILRYERYDAKADLWSVGTVLYEMATGKPPFRAGNHVELLRKIEAALDVIKFPRESVTSPELKSLIRALLKRNPVERISFADFFNHPVITDPIPGLVEDDIPKLPASRNTETSQDIMTLTHKGSFRKQIADQETPREPGVPRSPTPRRSSPLATPVEAKPNPMDQQQTGSRLSYSPRQETSEGLGIRRPAGPQPSTSAPARPISYVDPSRRYSNTSMRPPRESLVPSQLDTKPKTKATAPASEEEKAAQDVALEREYIFIDKKGVEVNALADQISLQSPKAGQIVRRATTATAGYRNGRNDHQRQGSYDKLSSSPGYVPAAISKAIQDASIRLFGFKISPQPFGKGQSPPQGYSPFPTYPTPTAPAGLISDGKHSAPVDEDARVAQCIEEWASRSDVVYGFAEVKYKQLVPMAPSVEYGLGGVPVEKMEEEGGLTPEAIHTISEEALVLYVKALSLLAKSMDVASLWWSRKNRETNSGVYSATRDSVNSQGMTQKINHAVQWIRGRFNEALEKTEIVRLKLLEAQKQLPEDHPSHPSNQHPAEAHSISSSAGEGVYLSPGLCAEKLMYNRAVEMSKAAAINEIASADLAGNEILYSTALRMLEAVLESDDEYLPQRGASVSSSKDEKADSVREDKSEMSSEDRQSVKIMMAMINGRLASVRKKAHAIESASRAQKQQDFITRRRSGEMAPRSVPA
ncbi:Serine/threonine-protein kinase ATG1 [Podospora fimiseda]|uniref:non-specific serine/threonine protein kinase n=1 Tax=Podospora fimiseda TaxID=252190 RepID=A0AAN7BYS0_9PEZI|nr:Serine/threonine-protein kinase ATG1 [Podospora fimiseda]